MHKKISLFALVLLIVSGIASIRNLPATAIFGSSLIFFSLFSALVFLIPVSIVAAEFTSRYSDEGGVFHWVRHAFGEKVGLVAIWLQWINTIVWYPTILSFVAGTAAYLIHPDLAQNKGFLIAVILIVFWGMTLLNFRGIHMSTRINSFCGIVGLFIPMTFLIVLSLVWLFTGHHPQIDFSWKALLPSFSASEDWVSLVAIMAAFLGMELAGVHVADIHNPQKNFPKAIGFSVCILLGTMIFGALSIAVLIPKDSIHLVDGIMQTLTQFLSAFHMTGLVPILAILIIIGSIGGMINWLISPAKGLLQAAEHGFLPPFFAKKNRHHVPVRLLVTQALLVSLFCMAVLFLPSINAFYWFFTALSTELYMLVYILLFCAAIKLGRPDHALTYRIPKGIRTATCLLGFCGCFLTIVVSYFPPAGIQMGSLLQHALLIGTGNIILIAPAFLLLAYREKSGRR